MWKILLTVAKGREGEYHLRQMKDQYDGRGKLKTEAASVVEVLDSDRYLAREIVTLLLKNTLENTPSLDKFVKPLKNIINEIGWSIAIKDKGDFGLTSEQRYGFNFVVDYVGTGIRALIAVLAKEDN